MAAVPRSGTPETSAAPSRPVDEGQPRAPGRRAPPPAGHRGHRGGRGGAALRRLPAGVPYLSGELRRGEHPAHVVGHAARQPPAARLVPVGRLLLPDRAAAVRAARGSHRPAHRHRARRGGDDLHAGRALRRPAGPGPAGLPEPGRGRLAADGPDRRPHDCAAARGGCLRPAAVRRAHRHRGPADADLAGDRSCQPGGAALPPGRPHPGRRRPAADLGAGGRPARARGGDRPARRGLRRARRPRRVDQPETRVPTAGPPCRRAGTRCPSPPRRSSPTAWPRW